MCLMELLGGVEPRFIQEVFRINGVDSVSATGKVCRKMSQHAVLPHFRTSATPDYSKRELVDRETFVSLLVARRRLLRCDDTDQGLRGLLDQDSGHWYVIKEAAIEN